MAANDKTVFDPGATVRESSKTVLESGADLLDGGTTMQEATLFDATGRAEITAMENAAIEKGNIILGIYRIESHAIEGGMGSVWRVHHTGWNVDLAMKRPQPKCFSTEESKADFIHECEAWINLGLHPNIVSCYYVREIQNVPTIFSEWMDGGSLESAIQRKTLYEGTEAAQRERLLDIAIQFARGLHYAHEAGLIHQDVKPDNVLFTKEGDAKVADFGLAKARAVLTMLEGDPNMNKSVDSGKTMLSPSGGYTPAYCSMEQMDGRELTRRTDIYSWAVSVMEMYIGSRPWANGVVAGLSCSGYFEQARVLIPEALKALLAQCLESEPEKRPHDFAEIEVKLHKIYETEMGNTYPRPAPKAAADTADSLNNRALSMLDLGKTDEAEQLWERALKFSPSHLLCAFNQALHQLQSGALSIEAITEQWRSFSRNSKSAAALLPKFYQSIGDHVSAETLLSKSKKPVITSGAKRKGITMPLDLDAAAAFLLSDDGVLFAPEPSDTDICARDFETGKRLYNLKGAAAKATSIAMSPDGRYLASGGLLEDGRFEVCLFDRFNKTLSRRFHPLLRNHPLELHFFDNGTKLFAKYIDPHRTLHGYVHDVESGAALSAISWYTGNMCALDEYEIDTIKVHFDGGNSRIVAANGNDGLAAYKANALGEFKTDHPEPLLDVSFINKIGAFSGDGKYLATMEAGQKNGLVQVYRMEDGKLVSTIKSAVTRISGDRSNNFYWRLAINRNGSKLCFLTKNLLQVWQVDPVRCLFSERIETPGCKCRLRFGPDDSLFIIVQKNDLAWVPEQMLQGACVVSRGIYHIPATFLQRLNISWQLSRVKSSTEYMKNEALFLSTLSFATKALTNRNISDALEMVERALQIDGFENDLRARKLQKEVQRYCVSTGLRSAEPLRMIDVFHEPGTLHAYFSKNGETIYTCFHESWKIYRATWNIVAAFDIDGSNERAIIGGSSPYKLFVCAKSSDRMLMAAMENNACQAAYVMDDGSGQYYHMRHPNAIRTLAISDDGTLAALVGNRQILKLWDLANNRCKYDIQWDQHRIDALCFSPDNAILCAGTSDGKILRLDILGAAGLPTITHYDAPIVSLCFSPDATHLLVAFQNKTIIRIDAKTGAESSRFVSLISPKYASFTNDGKYIIISGTKDAICLHDASTGTCFYQIKHLAGFKNTDITNDGRMLLASGENGCVQLWDLCWLYSFPGWADWDEGARPYLEIFLTLHPNWTEMDFQSLILDLQNRGYGWLRPEGVRAKLLEMKPKGGKPRD